MLNRTSGLRNIYNTIQSGLFYMIPEKWDKIYLYASVIQHYNNIQTGEMFFYYFPKSLIKKNPVNVYEVPSKFNIDESSYLKLAENLYQKIKELRNYQINNGEKPWTNITISIKNFKFNIEYNYEDLVKSKYSNYDRHLIWRYKYLEEPLSSYSKTERKMVEKYLSEEEYHNKNITTYNEGIYEKPISNIIEYNKKDNGQEQIDTKENEDQVLIKFYKYLEEKIENAKMLEEKLKIEGLSKLYNRQRDKKEKIKNLDEEEELYNNKITNQILELK